LSLSFLPINSKRSNSRRRRRRRRRLETWKDENVESMECKQCQDNGMFMGAVDFNELLNDWNVSGVTNMKDMFSHGV